MKITLILLLLISTQLSHASKCGEVVYNKYGLLKKYNYLNLSWTENTKKHGLSSTTGSSTEGTTAAFDPGVYTGASSSTMQSASTNGACKWGGFFSYVAKRRTQFIAQNLDVLRNQMAVGEGEMLSLLVESYFCPADQLPAAKTEIKRNFIKEGLATIGAGAINARIDKLLKRKFNNQCQIPMS